MIWSISWRNVWRNKLRSSVVIVAVALGLMSGMFTTAFMLGWIDQRMDAVLNTEMSYIQIHHPKFKDNYDFNYLINQPDKILTDILKMDTNIHATKRLVVNSMIASAENSTGAMIKAIDPDEEKKVSDIFEHIIKGDYFNGETKNPVVIGKKLADKLDVDVHNKIVITVQDVEGNIISGAFRIAGIYKTDNSGFDGNNVFIRYKDMTHLTGISSQQAHEIAVMIPKKYDLEKYTDQIASIAPKMLTENWKTLAPEMGYMDELMGFYMYMIIGIILFALCFAIINTMLMAVLERIKELGMLMAVGMNKARVFLMLMLESVFLTLTGGIAGILFGYAITLFFVKNGIDLSMWGEGLEDMGFPAIIYPVMDFGMIIPVIILVIITGLVSAIYPAYKALKLNPSEAIRTE